MDRWRALRRFQGSTPEPSEPSTPTIPAVTSPPPPPTLLRPERLPLQPQPADLFPVWKPQESLHKLPLLDARSKRDYFNVASRPQLMRILARNGELKVLFADRVLKVGASGKIKRLVLLVTDFSIYILDSDGDILRRKVVIAAVNKLCLSNFADHFLAIVIQNEYDCLLVSTRKMEIVSALLEATGSSSADQIDVAHANSFTYRPSAQSLKEVVFELVEEGIKTKIVNL